MKNYETYHNEYLAEVFKELKNAMVVKENIYISCKWQADNNFNPWDSDADEKLLQLQNTDTQLFSAVMDGINQMNDILNNPK